MESDLVPEARSRELRVDVDFPKPPYFSIRDVNALDAKGTGELTQTLCGGSCTKITDTVLF